MNSQRDSQAYVVVQSQNSIDLSPSLQFSRAALMKLKESSHSPNKQIENNNSINHEFQTLSFRNQRSNVLSNPKQSLESEITS